MGLILNWMVIAFFWGIFKILLIEREILEFWSVQQVREESEEQVHAD